MDTRRYLETYDTCWSMRLPSLILKNLLSRFQHNTLYYSAVIKPEPGTWRTWLGYVIMHRPFPFFSVFTKKVTCSITDSHSVSTNVDERQFSNASESVFSPDLLTMEHFRKNCSSTNSIISETPKSHSIYPISTVHPLAEASQWSFPRWRPSAPDSIEL